MLRSMLFMLGFIAIGIAFGFKAVKGRIQAKAAQTWPKTKGKVLTSEVTEDRFRSVTGKASIAFIPEISYQYLVNGKMYESRTVIFGETTYDYITASNICEKFAVDSEPVIYYNPNKPADSVLLPQVTEGLRSLIPGIFFVVVGIMIGIMAFVFPS